MAKPLFRLFFRSFAFCLMLSCAASGAPAAFADQGKNENIDSVCGPRCIQYLLSYYSKPSENLIDIIKEIQWPNIEQGVNLKDISTALETRSIYTKAVNVDKSYNIHWRYPVIYNFPSKGGVGHFVVRLPTSNATLETLWTGLRGEYQWATNRIRNERSKTVLLTSPTPIENVEGLATTPEVPLKYWVQGSVIAAIATTAIVATSWQCVSRRFRFPA